jgi:L-threonylcarbamoyladenylate synthase
MEEKNIISEILAGKIFIYPTDTVYGIGCNALNKESTEKIKDIKRRDAKPFSVIAPSFKWIADNLIVDVDLSSYLPGPYTIILKKKNKNFLNYVSNSETLGVRIPKKDFTAIIHKSKVPFITTSVNFSGDKPANKISDIPKEILDKVDIVIEAGELSGKPSTLIVDGRVIERK